MGFGEPIFLFAFLPALLLIFLLVPAACRNALLLLASLLFYAWGEPFFVLVALASALFDLLCARLLLARPAASWRRGWLTLGIAVNLGLLCWYKYAGFLYGETRGLLVGWLALPDFLAPALPIAVSFIVFEKITYLVDVARGTTPPARPGQYLLYVFLFPKLLAGPILRYHELAPQLGRRPLLQEDLVVGLQRFAFGLAKKLLVADLLAPLVEDAFGRPAGGLECWYAWLGLLAFTLQIYFDFSGYSDMAIGLARCFGFRLLENFDRPYLALSPRDFWRRWHMSLTRFIRDYLYKPLGGDRRGPARTYLNLWICFLLSGLWHGAAWTFLLWGAWHGLLLTLDRMAPGRLLARQRAALRWAVTLLLVMLGWVLFRAPGLAAAGDYLLALAGVGSGPMEFLVLPRDALAALAAGTVLLLLPAAAPLERWRRGLLQGPAGAGGMALALLLLSLSLGQSLTVSFQPFLYFRF